jgi:glycosyltransferase involved in cell wall biosynthesis
MTDSVHVLGSRQFGGADRFYVRLVEALNEAGYPALAVNRPGSPVGRALTENGAPQQHLPLANGWDLYSAWRLRRLLRSERPRIVQTYMGRATRLTRVPAELPSIHVARLGGYYKIRGYYEHVDAWVGNTRGVCDYLQREGLPAERIFMVGNFVADPEPRNPAAVARLREDLNLPADALVLFTLGRFIDIKGFDDLLDAFARLPAEHAGRPLRLVLVGDGPLRPELERQCRTMQLHDRVVFAGWQNNPGTFFHLADTLVCPSRHETLGNVILEGWSYGLPVVATDSPGATELIRDGDNGLLCRRRDPQSLAARLTDLLGADDEQRAALGAAGKAEMLAEHGRDAVLSAYISLYDRLESLGRRRGATG